MRVLLFLFLICAPACADLLVDRVTVHRSNIRVQLGNLGDVPVRPEKVELQVRRDESQPWHVLKVWNGVAPVNPGEHLVLDYLGEDPELKLPTYQLRALVYDAHGPVSTVIRWRDAELSADEE